MYRVWGSLPFDRADHFAHGVLDAFYPGYADSSYFHDERGRIESIFRIESFSNEFRVDPNQGFSAATPHGDVVDVLNTDAPAWLLKRYSVAIYAGAATRSGMIRAGESRCNGHFSSRK